MLAFMFAYVKAYCSSRSLACLSCCMTDDNTLTQTTQLRPVVTVLALQATDGDAVCIHVGIHIMPGMIDMRRCLDLRLSKGQNSNKH